MHTITYAADIINGAKPLLEGLRPLLALEVFVIVILMEALVLRGLKWGSLRVSFTDSAFVNLVSALVGVFFGSFILIPFNQLGAPPLS
jgi:hypothetical protein